MRRQLGSVVLVLGLAAWLVPGIAGAQAVNARIIGTFSMSGRVTRAVRVAGERPGERVRRRWTFTGIGCGHSSCRALRLRRQRSAGLYDTLTLRRSGTGRYAGSGRFASALACRGAIYPQGLIVPYRITVTVTQAVSLQGRAFAQRLYATYANAYRVDRTICPLGPSSDAAVYTGTAAPLPSEPRARFRVRVNGSDGQASFTDTSSPAAGRAPIVAYRWRFGDPRSGSADTARTADARHRFRAPGTYTVTLTVTDANGLRSTASSTVVAPGPPIASFTDGELATTLAYAFTDTSRPGLGGTRVTAWRWSFGDPASGAANAATSADPQHRFSAPGTYTVTLTVTDADGRRATASSPVTVPTAGG